MLQRLNSGSGPQVGPALGLAVCWARQSRMRVRAYGWCRAHQHTRKGRRISLVSTRHPPGQTGRADHRVSGQRRGHREMNCPLAKTGSRLRVRSLKPWFARVRAQRPCTDATTTLEYSARRARRSTRGFRDCWDHFLAAEKVRDTGCRRICALEIVPSNNLPLERTGGAGAARCSDV